MALLQSIIIALLSGILSYLLAKNQLKNQIIYKTYTTIYLPILIDLNTNSKYYKESFPDNISYIEEFIENLKKNLYYFDTKTINNIYGLSLHYALATSLNGIGNHYQANKYINESMTELVKSLMIQSIKTAQKLAVDYNFQDLCQIYNLDNKKIESETKPSYLLNKVQQIRKKFFH